MGSMPPATPLPSIKGLKLYLSYWRDLKLYTLLSVLFSLVLALQLTIFPLLIALVLGQLIRFNTINVGLLVTAGVFELLAVSAGWFFDKYGVSLLHHKTEEKLYEDSFKYLVHQDYGFFADRFSGSVVTQASRFAKSYTVFNDTMFFDLLPQLFTVLLSLIIMAYYSPELSLLVLVLWLFSSWLVVRLALRRLPMRRAAVAKESEQVGELADVITNALTVKTFAAEDREIERYAATNKIRGGLFLQSWFRAVRNAWVIEAMCVVLQMAVLIGGIVAVKQGSLGIATFLLFQVYALRIIFNIRRSTFVVRQLEVAAGDAQEMTELMEQAPNIQDKPHAVAGNIKKGEIVFAGMTFRHDDTSSNKDLFEDFSLAIKPGEKVGLVGPSGGGKTTIARLLLRFMDIQGGGIVIDGRDIRNIKQDDLRQAIAYVPQEPLLFHRSIKDNIRYGKPTASDAEVIAVAKKAFAHTFIAALPEGYDTMVGERGVKLSGGQRQRVVIARAILKNAPILILDEATSALDSESEQLIQKALWLLMKDKTAAVIAHRLSTIQRMDRIIVLDEGRIVEQGSHKQLLEDNGLYAKLWSHQSGGFLEE